jgi:hypothetical protein
MKIASGIALVMSLLTLQGCSKDVELMVSQHGGVVKFSFIAPKLFGLYSQETPIGCFRGITIQDETAGGIVWAKRLSSTKSCMEIESVMYGQDLPGYEDDVLNKLKLGHRYEVFIASTPASASGSFTYRK